ncbi:SNF2 helicase associated domain-containing protein, partial [Enterococcus faecalis]|uniref:SNF2 helicase associated domain-containing protein n=1 Tax=Enterococcus faecalis TaxID=1351 RepID=UPI0039854B8B
MRSLLQADRFYTTENGQVLSLETEAFQEASAALKKLRTAFVSQSGTLQVPLNQGLYLQEELADQATFSQG